MFPVPLATRPALLATKIVRLLMAAAIAVPLAACAGTGQAEDAGESRDGERIGTVIGALTGAILGSRIGRGGTRALGAIAGGALGAWLGGKAGGMLDSRDRELQAHAAEEAMTRPAGESVSWTNPESGNSGTITPRTETERTSDGATCRTFEQHVATGDGQTAATEGTACRQPDGTWHVVSK